METIQEDCHLRRRMETIQGTSDKSIKQNFDHSEWHPSTCMFMKCLETSDMPLYWTDRLSKMQNESVVTAIRLLKFNNYMAVLPTVRKIWTTLRVSGGDYIKLAPITDQSRTLDIPILLHSLGLALQIVLSLTRVSLEVNHLSSNKTKHND